jgi:hypothetical protein
MNPKEIPGRTRFKAMGKPEGGAQIECPDEGRWLDVASGVEDEETAILLSEHAATCSRCGERLRDAVRVLSDDEDPEESRFMSTLDSSQLEWRRQTARNLAGQLAEVKRPTPKAISTRGGWRIGLDWRTAGLAAALILAVVWISTRARPVPRTPLPPATGTVARDTGRPPARTPDGAATVPSGKPMKATALIAKLTLEPGLTRGLENVPVVRLASATFSISATLLFLDEPPRDLRFYLTDSAGEPVWTGAMLLSERDVRERRALIDIPAKDLRADDYQLSAMRQTDTGEEQVAAYRWRINRQ